LGHPTRGMKQGRAFCSKGPYGAVRSRGFEETTEEKRGREETKVIAGQGKPFTMCVGKKKGDTGKSHC